MKPFIACVAAVLLWVGVDALAQGSGPGKGNQTQAKGNAPKPDDAQKDAQGLAGTAQKDVGKGSEAAKGPQAGATAPKPKQGGPSNKDAARPSDAMEKGKALGKEGAKQGQAFQKQLQHEDAKHMSRRARLVRIRELAAQKGDTEMVARVEKLMEKEQHVHNRKLQRLHGQPRATQQPPAGAQPGVAPGTKPDPGRAPQGAPGEKKETGNQGPSK
ncbi:MAG: hypothetical protein ABFD90_01975 [Phycisphaerales bacterium]